jgi:predicted RNase H-like HicB family nuclease
MRIFPTRQPSSFKVTVHFIVETDDDGFHAYSPILKGLHVDGSSEQDAVRNFVDAAPAYLASVLMHGEPLPIGVIVDTPYQFGPHVTRHSEEIDLTCVPPSLLTSGTSSRA